MKKIIIVLLTLVMLFITGCSKAPSPSNVVEKMIEEEMKTAPIEKFGEGLFAEDANEIEKEVYNQLMAMLQKQSYTLGDEKVDGDKATVDVHFKTFDFGTSFEKTFNDYLTEGMSMYLSGADDEELYNLMYEMWKEDLIELEKEGLTKEGTFTFELVKKDKTWELTNGDSEELADIYFGGLYSIFNGVTGG